MAADGFTVTEWWWVRHAPVRGYDGRYLGRLDPPADLAEPVSLDVLAAQLPAGAVWLTTPLARARQTAETLAGRCGVGMPCVEPDLIEQDFGLWQGRGYDAVYAETGEDAWRSPGRLRPEGGESFADMMPRIAGAVDRLSLLHAGRCIVAIAHAGTIRAALAQALDLTPDRALGFQIDTLTVTRIDRIAAAGPGEVYWRLPCVNR